MPVSGLDDLSLTLVILEDYPLDGYKAPSLKDPQLFNRRRKLIRTGM